MIVTQDALETEQGTSRFAVEGNNLFVLEHGIKIHYI